MKTSFLTLATGLCALAAFSNNAAAETIYVDKRYGPGGTGTSNAPYNTIQAAINRSDATLVVVFPGTYDENLVINKSLQLRSYDGPLTTKVNGSAGGDTISVQPGLDVWIEGLNISSGVTGLHQVTSGTLHVRNCVVCGNSSHGILIQATTTSVVPVAYIYNCLLVSNGGSGLYWDQGGGYVYPIITALNTIFIGNARYAIEVEVCRVDSGSITLDYNDYVDNVMGQFNCMIGPGQQFSSGAHSLSIAPGFVGGSGNICNQDFRLLPSSPCKDVGHPGIGFLDPDGTRNDIGAYGGPAAQNFYTNPNDGPMIRNVTIDQGMVPRGSTFTIRATGAVR